MFNLLSYGLPVKVNESLCVTFILGSFKYVKYGLIYLIHCMLNIAALRLSVIWCFIDNCSSSHVPSRQM